MTKELEIKKSALEAFNNQDYPKAFNALWALGVEEFLQYSQRENRVKFNWLSESQKCKKCKSSSSYFWNTFILQSNVFTSCFTSNRPLELLHNYYSKTNIFNKLLEVKLATEYPDLFVDAIRKNEVFFKIDRIDFLLRKDLLNSNYTIHQDVWKSFQIIELKFWTEIQCTIIEIEKYPLERILFCAIEYFETNNFKARFDVSIQSFLEKTYSFFMSLILGNSKIKQENLSSEYFEVEFVNNVYKSESSSLKKIVFESLERINNLQVYKSRFFEPYCFNNQFQPKRIYESLFFYESPESFYQWNVDELRYKVNNLNYAIRGHNIINEQLANGAEIVSERKEDYHNNLELVCNSQSIIEILKDLQLTYFHINRNNKIKVEKIVNPLCAYAFHEHTRYYGGLKELKTTDSWKKAHLHLVHKNKENKQLPFIHITKKEYLDMNLKAHTSFNKETGLSILKIFGVDRSNFKSFDRFNVRYSFNEKPFILLGDHIFSPGLFFVNFCSHEVYVNKLLKNKNSRRTASKIEETLMDLLKKNNFRVKHTTKEEASLIDGDPDLILYDEENVLLIQLKRTNLRLGYKAQYYESLQIDLKAADQLNKAEKYLSMENPVFEIKNRKITKWVVSNSFEKTNTKIHNCKKINYLDLVNFLSRGIGNKTLTDFISYFETDSYFEEKGKPMSEQDDMFKKRFSLTNMEERNLYFKDFDSNKAKKYYHFQEKGVQLNAKGQHKQAVNELKNCLELETKDDRVYGDIANIYADLKYYDKAFFYFKKALEITPNDPFVIRNYAIALEESGNDKCLDIYSQITKKYPLLNMS